MQYELFYLVGASKEAESEKIKNEVKEIVEKSGGKFLEKETIEKRKLSYSIRHENHGIYIARRFELEDNAEISRISQKLNLNNKILRFILSKAQDLPELKSKEERIAENTQKEKTAVSRQNLQKEKEETSAKKEEKKIEKIETAEVKEEKKEDEKIKENEDIDKKLEEILNI